MFFSEVVFLCLGIFGQGDVFDIDALIEKMGSEKFSVRQQAYIKLVKRIQRDDGRKLFPVLEKAMCHKNHEISYRAQLVIEQYYNVQPRCYPYIPWIDMLPEDIKDKQIIVRKYLEESPEPPWYCLFNSYPRYRYATMLYARDLLDKGMLRSEVVKLFDKMAEKEKEYKRKTGID